MGVKKILFLFILAFLILLQSCEDILLKKTVSVEYLNGEINFDPSIQNINGNLSYNIKNNQKDSLKEIYLISHERVSIDYIAYQNETMRFEEGLGYGYAIYRIKIPVLRSGIKAKIEVKFHVNGPIQENRFLLTRNSVFIDAKMIWIPVPFAEIPRFYYSITVKTPENYYPVLGAKMTGESVKNNKRLTHWESETSDVMLSGNIFITSFKRYISNNIYYYSSEDDNVEDIFRYTSYSMQILSNYFGGYPYSQLHIISELFQYKEMEEFIDGEFLANIIQISPDLYLSNKIKPENELVNSALPFIPRDNQWKLFEVLAHEISHAYIGNSVKFYETDFIAQEALAEFTGLAIIAAKNQKIYKKYAEGNHYQMINMMLNNTTNNNLWKYFFGINSLYSAFGNNIDLYFVFLKLMLEKYGNTEIGLKEFLSTSLAFNKKNFGKDYPDWADLTDKDDKIINAYAFYLWNSYMLYNTSLSLSNIIITNKKGMKNITEEKRLILINNNFPLDQDYWILTKPKTNPQIFITNPVKITQKSEIGLVSDLNDWSINIQSHLQEFETKHFDNFTNFETNSPVDFLSSNINQFYKGEDNSSLLVQKKKPVKEDHWHDLYWDREKSFGINSNVYFIIDNINQNEYELYLKAYRFINNQPFSYVIFKIEKTNNQYNIVSILDPNF